jgi:hypothetical protein
MGKTAAPKTLQAILESLKSASFEVASQPDGSYLISKYGAAAVLSADKNILAGPGAFVHGHIAVLLDRGFQKFLKTDEFELPATATQLAAIHRFTEELDQLIGAKIFFNQALGTTSDVYNYDRIKGRDTDEHRGFAPWQTAGH